MSILHSIRPNRVYSISHWSRKVMGHSGKSSILIISGKNWLPRKKLLTMIKENNYFRRSIISPMLQSFHQIYLEECLRDIQKDFSEAQTPINNLIIEHAKDLIHNIPFTITKPEISAFPSGKIVFEWYLGPNHQFAISVGEGTSVAYSGLLGNARFYGWKQLSLVGDLLEKVRVQYGLNAI